ncbi:MAG: hypothetical protein E3J60_04150 [Dehalococcoidia bacterium]|nr:MAG: hypothetical protein E3J60_04150 [Dehalococcoidia bacterium]
MTGHCSKCGKIWTLQTRQGVCQWCGKSATCQSQRTQALRSLKSRANGRKRQARPVGDNGYDQLDGDWLTYYKVAQYFTHRVRFDDREDFLHDLMLEMATVKAKYQEKGKPLTEAGLMRVASYELSDYWVKQRRLTTWLDCGNCSKEQRRKCRDQDLYSDCPKYHQLVSLNTVVGDDGHKAELIEFLADDNAIDIVARLDARRYLQGFPRRIVQIAYKKYSGYQLDGKDRYYLCQFLKKTQKPLF